MKQLVFHQNNVLFHQNIGVSTNPLVDLNLDKGPDETFIPGELLGCLASKQIKQDPEGEQAEDWEGQGQESLKVKHLSHLVGRQRNSDPWDDAKIFLISFEQVAEACRWPKAEWMARLLPALTGSAREAFNGLETIDQEDYGKVKAAILRGAAFKMEAQRQHFRQFRYQEVEDPRRVYSDLRELCYQWLKPEKHTKEEILELLILEQFLAILPPEIQSWIRECDPENWVQTTDLMEDFLMSEQEAEMWKQQSSMKDDGEAGRSHGRNVTKEQLLQVPVSSKDRIGDACNPVKELLFVENKEYILGDWRSAHPDDENSPCNRPVTFPLPEGQDFVETGPNEGSVDLELAVHFTEGECSSLDPVQKAVYKEILQDGREKGTSLDHFTAAEFKKETLQLGSPEPEGDHQTESSCGEGFVKPLRRKEDADLENAEGKTLPRRWLWEEGQALNQHLTHISEQKQSSPECGALFHSRPPMAKRRPIHVDVKPTEQQDVPSCEKGFFAHRAFDVGERPGVAAVCGRRFREWIQPSQRRARQVRGDQAYQCSSCQKEFQRKRNLVAHQKIHTGERPYTCSQCGKSFTEKAKLIRHERVHTGEKPYACPVCPKNFSQRETMLKHQRIHAREKSYPGLIGRFWTARDAVEGSLNSPREKLQ